MSNKEVTELIIQDVPLTVPSHLMQGLGWHGICVQEVNFGIAESSRARARDGESQEAPSPVTNGH